MSHFVIVHLTNINCLLHVMLSSIFLAVLCFFCLFLFCLFFVFCVCFFTFLWREKALRSAVYFTWLPELSTVTIFNVIVSRPGLTYCVSNVKQKVTVFDHAAVKNSSGDDVCSIITFV